MNSLKTASPERKGAIFFGLIFTCTFAARGFVRWFFAGDNCSGSVSLSGFARLCHSDLYGFLFLISNFVLLGVIIWLTGRYDDRQFRLIVVGLTFIYGVWVILFSSTIWDAPYFTSSNFPPGVNPHCTECPLATVTPMALKYDFEYRLSV